MTTTTTKPHPIYLKAATGAWISHADIASLVRSALRRTFPKTAFAVRTKTYSGGGSVTVQWTDGPIREWVEKIAGQYETKGFDGSIDLSHTSDLWLYPDGTAHVAHASGTAGSGGCVSEVIADPRAADAVLVENIAGSYISVSRNCTAALIQKAIARIQSRNYSELSDVDWSTITATDGAWGATIQNAGSIRFNHHWLDAEIMREASKISA